MLPVETILSVFPSTARVGNLTLRPLTLYHATAMDVMGVDLGDKAGIDAQHIFIAAWLMTMLPQEVKSIMGDSEGRLKNFENWLATVEVPVDKLMEEVNGIISSCLSVNVPGKNDGKKTFGPRGFGWTLELGEAVAHEYSVTFDYAMSMPISTVFGMIACCRQRNSGESGGPDYYERILLKSIREMKEKVENGRLD